MKLNQNVLVDTNFAQQHVMGVKPRAGHVELYTLPEKEYVQGHAEPDLIDAESAISLGTALIEAGNVTRMAQDEDGRCRTLSLDGAFQVVIGATKRYLSSEHGRLMENELDAIEALILIDQARRVLAQNQGGHLKGTGIYVRESAAAYERTLYRNQGVFIAMQERRAKRATDLNR